MTQQEVIEFVQENDVKFIRLAFVDLFGAMKNIAVMASELPRAFEGGISFDASAVKGFCDVDRSELFLKPDPNTLTLLPWRPQTGRVARMMCECLTPEGKPFDGYSRTILRRQVEKARNLGYFFRLGTEYEFYLFQADENGEMTLKPQDQAGYMDVSPLDKGENIRREICLTLERMGICPESSHHEEGPGQNEIDFRYSDALSAADNAVTFRAVVKTIAARNGLYADFSPKPIADKPGSGFHINLSVKGPGEDLMRYMMGGILKHVADITRFLNPSEQSYSRLGAFKAPKYISWSNNNRSMLIRIPAASGEYRRVELRSPDCTANPYIAFALLIWAGLDGIQRRIVPPENANVNLFTAAPEELKGLKTLPLSLSAAVRQASSSGFVRSRLPESLIRYFCG